MAAAVAVPATRPATAARWQALRVLTTVPENKDVAIVTPVALGTRVQCTVTRSRGLRMKFVVEQQLPNRGKEFLMAARMRSRSSIGNYFISTNVNDINRHGQTFVGRTRAKPSDAVFTLLDSGGGFRHPRHLPDLVRAEAELAVIKYTRDPATFYGPRQLTIILPRVMEDGRVSYYRTTSKHDALLKTWQENPSNTQMTVLRNKQPVWDADGDIVLQFGRCGPNDFVLDFTYPLCPLQAFGIALSSMGFIMARD